MDQPQANQRLFKGLQDMIATTAWSLVCSIFATLILFSRGHLSFNSTKIGTYSGVPKAIKAEGGAVLDMNLIINQTLKDNAHVWVLLRGNVPPPQRKELCF